MTPIPLVDGDTFILDNSGMETFTTCPRQASYTIARRLRPTGERVPLHFGGIMHKVLEARYLAGLPMYEQTAEVEAKMVAVATEEFTSWSPPEDEYRNYDRMIDLIRNYGTTYPIEPFTIITLPNGHPAIEVPFALPLGTIPVHTELLIQDMVRDSNGHLVPVGTPRVQNLDQIKVLWTGKIDMIYSMSDSLYILDHKSSSIATNMVEFEISHQFYGYTWATETLLNKPVSGICINRVVVRKPSRTGIPFTFERKLIPVSRGLLIEWQHDILNIIASYLSMSIAGHFPKHTSWCAGKFGTCPFHKVCTLDTPEQREILLTSGEFAPNTWSPLST